MAFPTPEPSLVVGYEYLWHHECLGGREAGRKDRPSAIVFVARRAVDGWTMVTVLPITHSAPDNPDWAIEIPAALKRNLGLDDLRSWIVVGEGNQVLWPGLDLRSAGNSRMARGRHPRPGDVYWIDPNPVAGREMKDRHRFVVITLTAINALGVAMTVPVTTSGAFARNRGLTVPIYGHETTGVAVCNQVRTFDIDARMRGGSARYIETLDAATTDEIVSHVLSVIDPGDPKPKSH